MKLKLFLLTFITFALINCKEDKKLLEAKRILKEWTGKTVKFPEIKSRFILYFMSDYFIQQKNVKPCYIDFT